MKRFLLSLISLLLAGAAFAQSPLEIVSLMEQEMNKHEKEGMVMTVSIKIPILGTMKTRTFTLGDKLRMDASMAGAQVVTWSDGTTKWTYESKENKIEIENENPDKPTSGEGDAAMFKDITEGYDVSIKKETPDAWYLQCRKSRNNKEKDDPRNMDLVIAKGSFLPVSLSASLRGVTLTMSDISFGVTDAQVTFNPDEYPGATIVDKCQGE